MEDSDGCISISEGQVPSALLHLASRLETLKNVVRVFRGWNPDVFAQRRFCLETLSSFKNDATEIRTVLDSSQLLLGLYKEEIDRAQKLKFKCDFIINNIPDRFNCPPNIAVPNQKRNGDLQATKDMPLEPAVQSTFTIPNVLYLSVEEFAKVPKYMKGRVTYDKLNTFIHVFNTVIKSKYTIFKKKKSTLKKKDADLWNEFYKQELKETKGLYFCVGEDFKTFTGCPLDKAGLNMLTILRHCGRIRELRTGGINRYVAMF